MRVNPQSWKELSVCHYSHGEIPGRHGYWYVARAQVPGGGTNFRIMWEIPNHPYDNKLAVEKFDTEEEAVEEAVRQSKEIAKWIEGRRSKPKKTRGSDETTMFEGPGVERILSSAEMPGLPLSMSSKHMSMDWDEKRADDYADYLRSKGYKVSRRGWRKTPIGRELVYRVNPSDGHPPGFKAAVRMFEGFHEYDVREVFQFPASLRVPPEVYYGGPCTYMTYRSDKWNDGTHDYIHKIESYPHVALGFVDEPKIEPKGVRRVPAKITQDATLVPINKKAIGFGYKDKDGTEQHVEVNDCKWWWHPAGRAYLLIRNRRKLIAVVWGGKLGYTPRGIVG